jgi:hypothetical protein
MRIHAGGAALAAASGLASALTLSFGHVIWYGDSHTFFNYAADLLNYFQLNPSLQWRSPGYPLVLIATGVPLTGSVAGLLFLQALAGAAIPLLIYWTLLPIDRWAAFLAAWTCILSGIAYAFITTMYHDTLFMFLLVAVAALLVRILRQGARVPWSVPLLLTISLIMLAWLRPSAYLIAGAVLGAVLCGKAQPLRRVVACAAVLLVVVVGFDTARAFRLGGGPAPGYGAGAQLLYRVYPISGGLDAGGPGTARLREAIVGYFTHEAHKHDVRSFGPRRTEQEYQELYGRFEGRPDAQADAMLRSPHSSYYWTIVAIAHIMHGRESDRLLREVTSEQIAAHPLRFLWTTIKNYIAFVLGPPSKYRGTEQITEEASFEAFAPWRSDANPAAYARPIAASWTRPAKGEPWERELSRTFARSFQLLLPLSYLGMLIGVLGAFLTQGVPMREIATIFAVHTTFAGPMAVLVDPEYRYQLEAVPLAMLGAGYGVAAILRAAVRLRSPQFGAVAHNALNKTVERQDVGLQARRTVQ